MSKTTSKNKTKIHKLTIVTAFPALLREGPEGGEDAVFPEPLTKNQLGICLLNEGSTSKLYKDSLCLFEALVFDFYGKEGIEEKLSEMFNP